MSWTLGELLQRPELAGDEHTVIHASIFDPAAVDAAIAAGVGGTVEVEIGGHIDSGPRGPVPFSGEVDQQPLRLARRPAGPHQHPGPPEPATPQLDLEIARGVALPEPFHRIADFTRLGLDPLTADIVIVKIGYLEPQLYEAAAGWKLGLTPGGVDQDLLRLGHHNLQPGVFPFEKLDQDPDLTPVVTRR